MTSPLQAGIEVLAGDELKRVNVKLSLSDTWTLQIVWNIFCLVLDVTVTGEQIFPRCDLAEILNTLNFETLFMDYFYGLFLLGQEGLYFNLVLIGGS